MELTSPDLIEGGTVPVRFTCEGENVSPELRWSGVPESAASLRLSVHDPDAPSGTFVHWSVDGIVASATGVDEGATPAGGTEHPTSTGSPGYVGPCPPRGHGEHRYVFTIEALGPAGDVVDRADLTARFGRPAEG